MRWSMLRSRGTARRPRHSGGMRRVADRNQDSGGDPWMSWARREIRVAAMIALIAVALGIGWAYHRGSRAFVDTHPTAFLGGAANVPDASRGGMMGAPTSASRPPHG